jgi:hypothetical protein
VSNGVMVKLGKQVRGSDQGSGSGSSRLLQRSGFSGAKSIRAEVSRAVCCAVEPFEKYCADSRCRCRKASLAVLCCALPR